jgi:hypothetical protein
LEWTARGEGLGLCLEDREALGLWEVDDTRLPVLVSNQQETAQADQAEAGGARYPNAEPERGGSSSPYWFWCSQCARAQGLLVPYKISDLARANAELAQRVRALERDAAEWREGASTAGDACGCAVCLALHQDIVRLRARVAALRQFAQANYTMTISGS